MKNRDVELIANFMNWPIYNPNNGSHTLWVNTPFSGESIEANHIKFDTSWDWLMLVAIKIRGMCIPENKIDRDIEGSLFEAMFLMDIKIVYKAVIKFIKWYNEES